MAATINLANSYDWNTSASEDQPFYLSGRAMNNPPQGVKGLTVMSTVLGASSNYPINLATEHILAADQETTLRDNAGTNYAFSFACVHKGLQDKPAVAAVGNTPAVAAVETLELSIVFLSNNADIYHINVPIRLEQDSTDENLFLNSWLYTNRIKKYPPGFTFNQILNVNTSVESGQKTKVATNTISNITEDRVIVKAPANELKTTPIVNKYTFCRYNDSIKVNRNALPNWVKDMALSTAPSESTLPTSDKASYTYYRPRLFPEILKIMLPLVFERIPRFTKGSISLIYFWIDLKRLLGTLYPKSKDPKKLQNVKCYPIDLATQVNDDGTVDLDTSGLKAASPRKESDVINPAERSDEQTKLVNNVFYWIIIGIVGIVAVCIIIALVITLFSGSVRQQAMAKAVKQLTAEKASLRAGFEPTPIT
jgi:hypothetical protein